MNMSLYPRRSRGRGVLGVVGWLLLVALGIWLAWYGFTWSEESEQPGGTPSSVAVSATSAQATVWQTATPLPASKVPSALTSTDTPLVTAMPEPTAIPATAILATPYVVAGADGVNVRSGPGINYTKLGYLDPGAQAEVTDRDDDWWQIRYNGAPGWIFGELVTAFNVDRGEPSPVMPTTQAEPLPAGVETWPTEVFQLINSVRAEHGLSAYAYNKTLELAAQLHGQDCLQRGECSHIGSDGSNAETRILRAGYDAAGGAEVIVYSSSPQAAVDWWMDETPPNDPHRSTLLSTWFTEIGVAVVDAGHTYYFIADFGRANTP